MMMINSILIQVLNMLNHHKSIRCAQYKMQVFLHRSIIVIRQRVLLDNKIANPEQILEVLDQCQIIKLKETALIKIFQCFNRMQSLQKHCHLELIMEYSNQQTLNRCLIKADQFNNTKHSFYL
jgi:hypothetical protein